MGQTFIYNRLAFGLCSGPSSWQRLLEHVLRGIPNLFIYLDDCLIFSKSEEEHQKTLKEVLTRLSDNDMALSVEKCKFAQKEVEYLVGVVKFFEVPFLQQFSTDLTPKVNDQPRIFRATSIWSRTVVSNLKNASNLWCSKFNPKRNSFQRCIIWV